MDIIKIGNFIRECRKNKNLTQKQLADKLFVEAKTISKWETGKGLPDVSLMKSRCGELGISLSELFVGEHVKEEAKEEITEGLILEGLKKEEFKNKMNLKGEILIGCAFILTMVTLILCVSIAPLETVLKIILIVAAFAFIVIGLAGLIILDTNVGYFECAECHERFVPSVKEYTLGLHTFKKRKLTCPKCGKSTWCHKKMTKN